MLKIKSFPYSLDFKFAAGTSRGVLNKKTSWFITVEENGITGIGEAGPLPGLSIDDRPDIKQQIQRICKEMQQRETPRNIEQVNQLTTELCGDECPSIRFALETALLDLLNGGKQLICDNEFYHGKKSIPINGLIWMGDKETMRQRMQQKLEEGYSCLKMKIGAINFEQECAILEEVRTHFGPEELTLRVDANGAFSSEEAMKKLEKLASFSIHSIEQPIRQGQTEDMYQLCRSSPIPIALDEELIGVSVSRDGRALLSQIKPQFIILKPGLLGGLAVSRQWIDLADELGIGWWITSALESNIGLNAISQFTAEWEVKTPQGLGTGQLYHNNLPSPLRIDKGKLFYNTKESWDLTAAKDL